MRLCRNGKGDRTKAVVLVILILAVLVIARILQPDPRGVGTHQQLRLPPCTFQAMTGLPCPACGLTTSFAWLARGQLARATEANALGPPAFLALVLLLFYEAGVLLAGKHVELELSAAVVTATGIAVILIMVLYGVWRIGALTR